MQENLPNIKKRTLALKAARDFFYRHGYIEVETPVRIPAPALETHIDAPRSEGAWLRTSPEFHMKRLLVEGVAPIFQIGPCFRRDECGSRHNPEFTMLEWYRLACNYMDILTETQELLIDIFETVLGSATFTYNNRSIALAQEWEIITVQDAFKRYAGWNPLANWNEERFELDLMHKVEPALPCDRPCVLKDYPLPAAALARPALNGEPAAERWELYIAGLEISNTYSELCDIEEQKKRFEISTQQRAALGKEFYPADHAFLAALEKGLPACAGSALGFDRIMMLICDTPRISDVRLFAQHPGELY